MRLGFEGDAPALGVVVAAVLCICLCWQAGAAPDSSGRQPLPDWTDASCGNCHRFDALFSHPVGVVPTMPVPGRFPLVEGRIECVTCHTGKAADHRRARREKGTLLRALPGARFCAECHDHAGARSRMHAATLPHAHSRSEAASSSPRTAGAIDTGSRCLICHDGTIARDIDLHGVPGIGGLARSHPVDVPYRTGPGVRGGRPRMLKPIALLDRRIRLIGGRVGCASCHSLYSKRRGLLVMTNRGSRLCSACHAMN